MAYYVFRSMWEKCFLASGVTHSISSDGGILHYYKKKKLKDLLNFVACRVVPHILVFIYCSNDKVDNVHFVTEQYDNLVYEKKKKKLQLICQYLTSAHLALPM